MYHFIARDTAKLAGTERGTTESEATFSACFGVPILALHPSPDVPSEVLLPKNTWEDNPAYDIQVEKLARIFVDNYTEYEVRVPAEVISTGLKVV